MKYCLKRNAPVAPDESRASKGRARLSGDHAIVPAGRPTRIIGGQGDVREEPN
jgi:hypothetical protein